MRQLSLHLKATEPEVYHALFFIILLKQRGYTLISISLTCIFKEKL
ncbi:hypothetical protein TSMEX_006303 [Taenia solium]|eukprot:TsM_000200300 transcript=TsM_000200300 gene=TsM_000200300